MNLITRDNSAIPLIAKDGIHFKMNDYSGAILITLDSFKF